MEEPLEGSYRKLPMADIPIGWSNQPDEIAYGKFFTRNHVNETLHSSHHFSHALPILTDTRLEYIFEEKGRGYYVWNDISGSVAEIKESSLKDIITKIKNGGLRALTLSPLRAVDDPSGEPCSNIPYLPNPDFVDRPDLTSKFSIPPRRITTFWGLGGCGKSQLAIQYANKVRNHSTETWVFWLCATTKQKFDDDFAAIAEILPERSCKANRREQVLKWLCTPRQEPWLLVIDDLCRSPFRANDPIFPPQLLNSSNGSFIFTTKTEAMVKSDFGFKSQALGLKVTSMRDNEAFQLLQKKLKPARTDAEVHDLVTGAKWTPLAIELAATSLNLGLTSVPEYVAELRSRKQSPLALAFQILFDSVILSSRTLLYFIGFFNPPEVRKLWLLSYLEWTGDESGLQNLEKNLQSLTEHSLLAKISGGNAYNMHSSVQNLVVSSLGCDREAIGLAAAIRSFVDSQNYIPSPNPSGYWRLYNIA